MRADLRHMRQDSLIIRAVETCGPAWRTFMRPDYQPLYNTREWIPRILGSGSQN
jgi:hypothetical protein